MPENNFEHRVQQKMQEFQLPPSDLVWQEVERRIRKEKRRRFIFWWLLFAGILAGGIGTTLWLRSGRQNKTTINSPAPATGQGHTSTIDQRNTQATPSSADKAEQGTPAANATAGTEPATPTVAVPGNNTIILPAVKDKPRRQQKEERYQPAAMNDNLQLETDQAGGKIASRKNAGNESREQHGITTATALPVAPSTADTNAMTPDATTVSVQHADSLLKKDSAVNTTADQEPTITEPEAAKPKPVTLKQQKWKWEIALFAGRSSFMDGFGKFKQAIQADINGGAPPPQFARPAAIDPGFSFGLQVSRRKALTSKLDLVIGAGYHYYSTRMQVGTRVDSVRNLFNLGGSNVNVRNYFRVAGSSSSSRYTNRFHFAGVSAGLSWKIINRKKFTLHWRNELQYNLLAGSNMLHYDQGLPGYYQDNSLLRKGQLFFSTGLPLRAGNLLQISPTFTYGLTGVLNAGASPVHYSSAGLKLIFLLPGKK